MKTADEEKLLRSKPYARLGILCGTDFSEHAHDATRVAGAMARRLDEPLVLVHAIEMPKLGASHAKVLKWLTASRRKDLRRAAEDVRKTGVRVEERLPAGRPDEVLAELARTEPARLLVVSSIGRRGAARWLLGSVSERSAQRATIPTLVIRDARPMLAWAGGERPLKVFVCFNRTLTAEAALLWVKDLQAIGPCKVVIGFVSWPPEQWARLGGEGPPLFENNSPDVQAILGREVRAKADELLGNIASRVRVEAHWGYPDARLAEMAKEEDADLIVVGSHQYRGFERLWHSSVSRGLLHQAGTNVAVVPQLSNRGRRPGIASPVRRVLVATDFSELANAAIPHAYRLVRGGGTVALIHVIGQQPDLPTGRRQRVASRGRQNTPEARHYHSCLASLRGLIPAEAASQGVLTEVEVVESRDVAKGICQAAERLGTDVICLGSHGRSGLSGALLGSVAQAVMARSSRPLLIIRPQAV